MCKQGTRPVLDRVQPTAIGSPPDSFRLREMASVSDSVSVPSAERERGIEKTDELRRLKNARNRKFESISLQRRVRCEPEAGLVRRGCDGSLPVALLFRAGLRLRRQARTSRARQSAVAGGSVGQGGQGLATGNWKGVFVKQTSRSLH